VIIPVWAKDRLGHAGDTQAQPFPVSFDDIRHVIPLEDTETGQLQDVIVQHAYAAGPYTERSEHSKLPRFTRYVSGLDIEIPWPMEEEPVINDGDMDTTRMAVEVSTFTPSLEQPPMPSTVIDELRNKYSRFRTRHDPEYLREKMREDYRNEYRKTVSMMTPKTDAKNMWIAQVAERKKAKLDAEGNGILNQAAISFINKHIRSQRKKQPKTKGSKAKQAA
jgi:large subunit ribosomal protein L24